MDEDGRPAIASTQGALRLSRACGEILMQQTASNSKNQFAIGVKALQSDVAIDGRHAPEFGDLAS